jgi:hypothetical protein
VAFIRSCPRINTDPSTRVSARIGDSVQRRQRHFGFGKFRACLETRTETHAAGIRINSLLRGKEVPNGIRTFGDSRCIGRGLLYLAYQFQSTGEEERPDLVQYEVEPRLSFSTLHANPRCPVVGYGTSTWQAIPARLLCRLQLVLSELPTQGILTASSPKSTVPFPHQPSPQAASSPSTAQSQPSSRANRSRSTAPISPTGSQRGQAISPRLWAVRA